MDPCFKIIKEFYVFTNKYCSIILYMFVIFNYNLEMLDDFILEIISQIG